VTRQGGMSRIRFLVLTQYFPPEIGAAPTRLYEVTRALREHGHQVEVVTAMPNYPSGRVFPAYRGKFLCREAIAGQAVIRTWLYASTGTSAARRLAGYWSFALSSLVGCLLSRRPDVVLVESPPLFLCLTAYLYCLVTGTRFIVNVSDPWLEFARDMGFVRSRVMFRLLERLELFVYSRAFRVNAVTQAIRSLLIEKKSVPPQKVLWLPNGVDLDRFSVREPDKEWMARLGLEGVTTFIYAGSHQASHGLDVLIEAAARLDETIRILMVGDGTDKERLVRLARERGLRNIVFVDPQPLDEMPRLLSVARAALVVIRGEAAFSTSRPAKMLPAMACSLPIVYCGRGEGANIVQQGACGLVSPPGNVDALAGAIRRLAQDPELARRLGQNGRRTVERSSDWRTIVDRWLAELGELADVPEARGRDRHREMELTNVEQARLA
jgi:colanic acid biosynthesis glycosyl transferase WcaI